MPRSSLRFLVRLLLAAPALAAATPYPLITKEEVARSLAEQAPAWDKAARRVPPRLYFGEAEWPRVREQIAALSGPRAVLRDKFLESLDRILAEPLPVYRPPEQVVGTRGDAKTLYSAMEELWQRDVGNNIFALAIGARLYPDKTYRSRMRELVLAALAFDTWGRTSSKMGDNADLAAGHLLRGIAVAYDWHRAAFSADEQKRVRDVVAARAPNLLRGLYGDAFWARGYEDNHNHVSVAGLAFAGLAFHGEIPAAAEWLAAARLDFQTVAKAFPTDGSSPEGVSYWAYGVSYILQYIEATRPVLDSEELYRLPFLRGAAAYRLHASTPGLVGNLVWGDSVPRGWSTPHHIVYRLAAEYRDADAAWFADHLPPPRGGADEFALGLLWALDAPPPAPEGPRLLDYHAPAGDLVSTRGGWAKEDYLLAIKSGFTNRNHSHLDAGSLAIAFGDEWLLTTPGYGLGAGDAAFWQSGGARWDYFSNGTESHSTLLINGRNQRFDREARGTVTRFFASPEWSATTIDLTRAYEGATAVTRRVLHRRNDYILVLDEVVSPASTPAVVEWLAQFRYAPATEPDGGLLVEGKNGGLRARILAPSDAAFMPRAPTLPKVDVKTDRHFTYAAKGSGEHVSFVVLLQPVAAARSVPPLRVRTVAGGFEIDGDGWTDLVLRDETSGPAAELRSDSDAVGGSARLLVIRRAPDGSPRSAFAHDASELNVPGRAYHTDAAADIVARKLSDGGWSVTASEKVRDAAR